MSKFKIKMKLTGFELEIEGSREDVPNIQQALSRQLGGILQPAAGLISQEDEAVEEVDITPAATQTNNQGTAPKKRRKKSISNGNQKNNSAPEEDDVVNWPRDVTNYCMPNQQWKTAEKAMWTLYVAQEAADISELTGRQISNIFNKHYRQAKTIQLGNVNRDLGKLKLNNPAWVAEDTTKNPPAWYLTQEGNKEVQRRISELQSAVK
jgi:hypothetical protein